MENNELLLAHINDLIKKSIKENIITSTFFLSLSEQTYFNDQIIAILKKYEHKINFIFDGGNKEENDRKILFIIPASLDLNNYLFLKNKMISLLLIEAKSLKFSEPLSHRDFLGSLMNLGIKREMIGDIILSKDKKEGVIYLLSSIKNEILLNLNKIKHNSIKVKEISLDACPFSFSYIEKEIYISSLRLDSIIKETFNLSRNETQELINNESVYINGKTIISSSYIPKENDRISIKSKGKFIFLNENRKNKKGKLYSKIKLYD